MQKSLIVQQIKQYIAKDVLGGKDIGLDEATPLLEWGIINSLEMVRLLSFVRKQFAIDISPDKLVADNFANIASIAEMILKCNS